MDLHIFLQQFIAFDMVHVALVAVVVGGAVFAIIQYADKVYTRNHVNGLPGNVKFWSAVGLCVLIPLIAYLADSLEQGTGITWNGVFLAFAVAFTAATGMHWVFDAGPKAAAEEKAANVGATNA